MTKFNFKEIKWEEYDEVEADRYKLFYEQDTLVIRQGARVPAYFVRKDAKGTKEHQQESLDKNYTHYRDKITDLLKTEGVSKEKLRQAIERVFTLHKEFRHIYHPELEALISNLSSVREQLSGGESNEKSTL